jgi:hypothetical protein
MNREEARIKFLMPLKKVRREELKICLDLRTEQWVSILSESKRYSAIQM